MSDWKALVKDIGGGTDEEEQNAINKVLGEFHGCELVAVVPMDLCRRAYFRYPAPELAPKYPHNFIKKETPVSTVAPISVGHVIIEEVERSISRQPIDNVPAQPAKPEEPSEGKGWTHITDA